MDGIIIYSCLTIKSSHLTALEYNLRRSLCSGDSTPRYKPGFKWTVKVSYNIGLV